MQISGVKISCAQCRSSFKAIDYEVLLQKPNQPDIHYIMRCYAIGDDNCSRNL